MSLQLALLLIGIVVVAGVTVATFFRGAGLPRLRRAPGATQSPHVLSGRREPMMTEDGGVRPLSPVLAEDRQLRSDVTIESHDSPPVEDRLRREIEQIEELASMPLDLETDPKRLAMRAVSRPASPDALVEFVLNLPGEGPVARDEALGIYKQNEYLLEKPRKLFGKNLDAGYWTELDRDPEQSRYSDLALSIQLVDARGPLDESELNTFGQVGLKIAEALHRPTKFATEFETALERARTLQRFCEAFDVIAAIHVAAPDRAVLRGRDILSTARRLGMQFGATNIFQFDAPSPAGRQTLFSMANMVKPGVFDATNWDQFTTPGVTLFMNVPCVVKPANAFDRMAEVARDAASALGARLLDQDRRPLTDDGLAIIRGQIGEIEQKMRQFGIAPGSATALRLFSLAATEATAAPAPAHA